MSDLASAWRGKQPSERKYVENTAEPSLLDDAGDKLGPIVEQLGTFYSANRDDPAALARMLAGVRDVTVPAECQLKKLRALPDTGGDRATSP